jgi:hypothetical protein
LTVTNVRDRAALEPWLYAKLHDWRGLLTRNVTSGIALLRLLLAEPIRFMIDRRVGHTGSTVRLELDRIVVDVNLSSDQ